MAHAREHQKGEAPREQQERSRDYLAELPKTKAEFLQRHEQWIAQHHDGIAPEVGIKKRKGHNQPEVRKNICEDVAVKNEAHQLYMVLDGISSEGGWCASRMGAEILGDQLGTEFDKKVENWKKRMEEEKNPMSIEQVTTAIQTEIEANIRQTHEMILKVHQLNPREYGTRSGSTLALAKVVELPTGSGELSRRAFIAAIGDSPVYVQREDGSIEKITKDDSMLQRMLESGTLNAEDIEKIQRARNEDALEDRLHHAYAQRQVITQSLGFPVQGYIDKNGYNSGIKKDLVGWIDLNPGDRLILASDGFGDQFEEDGYPEIQEMMKQTTGDDAAADELMQKRALDRSRKGKGVDVRSKLDDIAAMAVTIRERERQTLTGREGLMERIAPAKLEQWRRALVAREQAVVRARAELDEAREASVAEHGDFLARERIPFEQKIIEAEKNVWTAKYNLKRAEVADLEHEVPPRLREGESVRVKVDSENGRHTDGKQWKVSGYDANRFEYTLENQEGETMQMSRFRLEIDQPKIVPRRGDVIPFQVGPMREPGFTVKDIDRRAGKVFVEKNNGSVVKEGEMEGDDLDFAYQGFLHRGQRAKRELDRLEDEYQKADEAEQAAKTQLAGALQMEARNAAMMRFKSRVQDHGEQVKDKERRLGIMSQEIKRMRHQVLSQKDFVEKKRKALETYKRLREKDLTRALSSDERAQLRAATLEVVPTPRSPEVTDEIIEKLEESYQSELQRYNDRVREYNNAVQEYKETKGKVITNLDS